MSDASPPALRLVGLDKSYGRKHAVLELGLEVESGTIYGLLGPNGAGKTTTLKMVAGLVVPDAGSIEISGIDALRRPDEARSLSAFVPDQPTLYPRLTGREFLRFIARARGVDPAVAEARIAFHENLFEMAGWLDMRAETYSHGMTQRVALSAAFLHRPPLYVIDEPLVGLDPASAETFRRMCRAAASSGATVILSSHTLSIVRKFCDRLGILHLGRLAAEMDTDGMTDEELERTFFGITGCRPAEVRDYFSSGAGSPVPTSPAGVDE